MAGLAGELEAVEEELVVATSVREVLVEKAEKCQS